MTKRILSVLTLIAFITGITMYGYDHQLRKPPALAQADTAVGANASEETYSTDSTDAAGTDPLPDAADGTDGVTTEKADGTEHIETAAEDTDAALSADITESTAAATDKEEPSSEGGANVPAVDMAKITVFPEPKIMYVQSPVNVRKGPDTSFDRIGSVNLNEELTILGQYENDGWYHFIYHDEDAFVSNHYVAETKIEPLAATAPAPAAETAEQTSSPAEPAPPAPEPTPAPAPAAAAGVLFIGDSRCVQMQDAVNGGGCTWVCENGKGYDWFMETALARVDNVVGQGTKVVMCLGVNDTRNCSNYAAVMNQKAADWAARGASTYFVSVNPVWENPYTSEEQVENFNASIVGQLGGIKWIDTHSWLVNNGYRLVDGLHYDANTYINIFNVIIGSL